MFPIITKKQLSEKIYYMDIIAKDIAESALPGQFLIVKIGEKGERIPLTICDYDREKGAIAIVFQVVGKTTEMLANLNVGDNIDDIVGPLGQPSEFVEVPLSELATQKYLFVCGGVGTAPVYPQVKWFHEHGLHADVIIGARNKDLIFFQDKMADICDNLYLCTDDGSCGIHGNVTTVISELIEKQNKHYDKAVIIGPMIMMKFASLKCREYGLSNIVSMNPLMIDGTGMCGACRVLVGDKVKFACVDGPEFDGDSIDFDLAMTRLAMYKTVEGKEKLRLMDGEEHHADACPIHTDIVPDKTKRVPVREQDPVVRATNFDEVCYGYDITEAQCESARCLQCKSPRCVVGCPVGIDIPAFIAAIKTGDLAHAGEVLSRYTSLPAVCGRVCPQESQCEGRCIVGIKNEPVSIGKLERLVGDYMIAHSNPSRIPQTHSEKVAVIGSGPSGLACAGELIKKGYDVTVFEALHKLGGVLTYGIPEFRLPKADIVDREIDNLKKMGVKFVTNTFIGKTITLDELQSKHGFKAIFIGTGAGFPRFMGVPGELLNGVISANEFLTRVNLMRANEEGYETPVILGKHVAVVGGGNVAMDAARTARRMGADVTVIYRRSEKELPARLEEIEHAKQEGIKFSFLVTPTEFIGDDKNWLKEIKLVRMQLGEPDASGRASFSEVPNSEHIVPMDTVIMSLGTTPNPVVASSTKDIEINKRHCIVINEDTCETTRKGVYAGGDAVSGAATVILAMAAGKKAAKAIDEFFK